MGRWWKDAAHTKFEDRQSYVQIVGKKKEKTTCLLGQILCLYRSTAHAATPIHMMICLFVSPCIELFHPQISHERIWIYIIYSFIFFIDFFHAHFYGCFGVGAQEAFSVVMDEVKKKIELDLYCREEKVRHRLIISIYEVPYIWTTE